MRSVVQLFLGLSVIFGLAACNEDVTRIESAVLYDDQVSKIDEVILLKDATEEELFEVARECPSTNERNERGQGQGNPNRSCIVICHKPPGNPENYKTLLIPDRAIQAHLHHGGPQHDHHDVLGSCEDMNDDSDNGSGSGGVDDLADNDNDSPVDNDDDEYAYCDGELEYDLDCDGLHDQTGEPVL